MMQSLVCHLKKCSKLMLALLVVSTLLPVSILHAQESDSLMIDHQYKEEGISQQEDELTIPWQTTINASTPFTLSDYEVVMEQETVSVQQLQVTANEQQLQNGTDYQVEVLQDGNWVPVSLMTKLQTNHFRIHFLNQRSVTQVVMQYQTLQVIPETQQISSVVHFATQEQRAVYTIPSQLQQGNSSLAATPASTITTTNDTLVSTGGNYDIGYILHNYNVFALGNYQGSHVVGPMIVLGEAKGKENQNLSVGGLSKTVDQSKKYPHLVPSYFKGKAKLAGNVNAFSDVSLYSGLANASAPLSISDENELIHPERVFYTDNFITSEGIDSLQSQVKTYMAYEGIDALGNMIRKVDITNDIITHVLTQNYTKQQPYKSPDGSYQMYVESSNITENKKVNKVNVELQLNHNFEFDSFDQVQSLIYDYANTEEAITTTTFIGTKQTGVVNMPRIMKTIPDEFGTNLGDGGYHFDSLESTKGINVIYFMNEKVTKVNVGQLVYQDDSGNTITYADGQRKLTGHLVAPSADVSILNGDYNGCVIGKNIISSAEGHMWPFTLDVGIGFYKLVNHEKPSAGETFRFRLHDVAAGTNTTTDQFAESNLKGLVHFQLEDYKKAGTYIYKITEETQAGYTDITKALYVKVEVSLSNAIGGNVLVPKVVGYYRAMNGNNVDETSKINEKVTYLNQRDLGVKKVWVDNTGASLDTTQLPDVNVELRRKGIQADGNEIVYNIYARMNGTSAYTKLSTNVLSSSEKQLYIKSGMSYQNTVTVNNANIRLDSEYTKLQNTGLSVDDKEGQYTDFKLSNINQDQEINLYYTSYLTMPTAKSFQLNWKLTDTENQKALMENIKTMDELVTSFTLGNSNQWTQGFSDLPSEVEKDGVQYKCLYYVKEESVPGYLTKIENQDILSGVMTIINQCIPTTQLLVHKVSSTGNNNALSNAKFQLLDSAGNILKFTKKDTTWHVDTLGTQTTLTSDQSGMIDIRNLPFGDYVLKEVAPPNGFAIKHEMIFLHIDPIAKQSYVCFDSTTSNGTHSPLEPPGTDASTNELQYSLTVENIPDLKMPQTGSIPRKGYQKEGTILLTMGMMFSGIVYKKKNEKRGK